MNLVVAGSLTAAAIAFTTLPASVPVVTGTSKLIGGSDVTDAIGHVVLFGLLTAAWFAVFRQLGPARPALLTSAAVVLAIATSAEIAQTTLADRGASVLDLIANALGVASFAVWWRLRRHERETHQELSDVMHSEK